MSEVGAYECSGGWTRLIPETIVPVPTPKPRPKEGGMLYPNPFRGGPLGDCYGGNSYCAKHERHITECENEVLRTQLAQAERERDAALAGGEGFWGRAAARLLGKLNQAEQRVRVLEKALRDLREWGEPELDHPALDYVSVQIERWAIKQADEALTPPPAEEGEGR